MSVAALLSLDEATAAVLAHCRRLPTEEVPVAQAAGRFLAETVLAPVDLPPFPASAMDGFALRAAERRGCCPSWTGLPPAVRRTGRSGPARRWGIATGGVVPEGADAVVPIEEVADRESEVEVPAAVDKGSNIRAVGKDIEHGEELVPAGSRLGAAEDRRSRPRRASRRPSVHGARVSLC